MADFRYAIPDPVLPNVTYPVLYVAGYGGVFRSLDNGQTWTAFPDTAFDGAPAEGGYLPNVDVTGLTLDLGAVNPATGHASQTAGDPEILLASTLGRGDFAIGLAPDVFPSTIGLDPTMPAPGGSQTGTFNGDPLTNLTNPFISGTSEVSNFGNVVTITLIDEANDIVIGTGTTDTLGHFSVQVSSQVGSIDPSFLIDGIKMVGIQATDSSGATGNVTVFTYVLRAAPPPAPTGLTLDPSTNSGLNPAANITNSTHPLFDVTGLLAGNFIELFRSIGGLTPILVGTGAVGVTQVGDTAGVPADGVYLYQAAQVNDLGEVSALSPSVTVTINTTTPVAPTLSLLTNDDSGLPSHPNTTNVRNPRVFGTAPFNSGTPNTPFPLDILSGETAGSTQAVALNNNGVILSTASAPLIVPAGQQITSGYVTLTLSNRSLAGGKNIGNLTVELIGPGGQTYFLLTPSANTAKSLTSQIFKLPGGFLTGVLSGTYTLAVGNSTPGDSGVLTSWSVTLLNDNANAGASSAQPLTLNNTSTTTQVFFSPSASPLSLPAGVQPTSGYVTLTISNTSKAGSGGRNIGNLAVELLGPGGQTYFLLTPSANTATSLTSQVFNLPSGFLTGVLSGAYTLAVANDPGDSGVLTSWSVTLVNGSSTTPALLATTTPSANGSYQVPLAYSLPDGMYTLVARTRNLAGTPNYSAPLTVTIKATGPQITPTLMLLPASDTGIKGDGVTANHRPVFTGVTDPGDTVTIYSLVNGVLVSQGTTMSSTVNGSFTVQLANNLTDGTTVLYAQTTDVAGNKGLLSAPLNLRIITVEGDYLGTGAAQIAIFDPNTETYYVKNGNSVVQVQADPTSNYRDVPVQFDFNGSGTTNYVGYRLDSNTYVGVGSNGATINNTFGNVDGSLPISGYYNASGTFIYANFFAPTATWAVGLPQPGGEIVKFVVPSLDIPVPAAYDGNGIDEIAVFRPVAVAGGDADSFSVAGPVTAANPGGYYQVSFTNPAIAAIAKAAGYTYKAGDIPAPADYDGVGRDEFAIYRPSTGQFFILNTPNDLNPATWTMRMVQMVLPGGPNVNDVPVSEDYDGTGHVDPAVYRPSTSTFYIVNSLTGIQEAPVQFGLNAASIGLPSFDIAPAGPLLYRLTALRGPFASTGGYPTPAGSGTLPVGGEVLHTLSVPVSASSSSTSSSAPVESLIAVATPIALPAATIPISPVNTGSTPVSTPVSTLPVALGVTTPKTTFKPVTTSKPHETTKNKTNHKVKVETPKKTTKPLKVETKAHVVETKAPVVESKSKAQEPKTETTAAKKPLKTLAIVSALQQLVLAKKGKTKKS